MIHRYKRCVGITLFRWRQRQLEVWFCPRCEDIEPHCHPNIDSLIRLLWGTMKGTIGDKRGWVDFWRPYSIPAGVMHAAEIHSFTIFVNWEKWRNDIPVSSAAVDFTAV